MRADDQRETAQTTFDVRGRVVRVQSESGHELRFRWSDEDRCQRRSSISSNLAAFAGWSCAMASTRPRTGGDGEQGEPLSRGDCLEVGAHPSIGVGGDEGHVADVNADSLFEAAVLALRAFKASGWTEGIGPATRVHVEVRVTTTCHIVSIGQIQRWTEGAAVSPSERLKRDRLKAILREAGVA
jgi:hypothetical protein